MSRDDYRAGFNKCFSYFAMGYDVPDSHARRDIMIEAAYQDRVRMAKVFEDMVKRAFDNGH
jgi:hypothetical protein